MPSFPSLLQTSSSSDRYDFEGLPPELAAEQQAINRRQQMANYLIQQGLQPAQGQMAGRFYVPPSPLQGLAGLAQAAAGVYGGMQADKERQGVSGKSNEMLQQALQNYQKATAPRTTEGPRPTAMVQPEPVMSGIAPQAAQAPVQTELPGPGVPVSTPVSPEQKQQAIMEQLILNRHPQAQRAGELMSRLASTQQENELNREVRREGIQSNALMRAEQIRSTMAITQSNIDARERAGEKSDDLKRDLARQSEDLQKTLKGMDVASREKIANMKGAEKSALKEHDTELGQQTVHGVVASLRDQYNQLNEAGGITNVEKGPLGNVVPGIAGSSPGQVVGKVFGTKNQSLRNTIAQQRPILMQAIMKATGMTAKQMDSNVELKLWLSTATDPTLDYQTNMKALEMLENLYGGKQRADGAKAPGGLPTPHAPYDDPQDEAEYQKYKQQNKPEFLKTHKPKP